MTSPSGFPYLTVQEVADRLRCHEQTIRRMCNRGEIRGAIVAGRWLIHERDLPLYAPARPLPPPRPRRQDDSDDPADLAVREILASRVVEPHSR